MHEVLPKGAWYPRRGGTVTIRVGDRIPVEGLTGSPGRKALAERTRAAFLSLGLTEAPGAAAADGDTPSPVA